MSDPQQTNLSRRGFLGASVAATMGTAAALAKLHEDAEPKAQIAITLDLEMSRHYPKRGMMEWDYQKGNLSEATKKYSVDAARVAKQHGGLIHFFCVGRVLEQANVDWIKKIAETGHPIGNHTYDHVNVHATKMEQVQFRFRRSPWLAKGRTVNQVIRENIKLTSIAMKERAGIEPNGFRTPGGFYNGISERPDLQQMFLDFGFDWISSKYPRHKTGKPKQKPTADVYASIVEAQKQAQPFSYPSGLIEIPMSPISDVTAFRSNFWTLDYFLKAIGQAVDWAIKTGGVFDFLAHPSCLVVEDPTFETIKLICAKVKESPDRAQIVGLDAMARRVKQAKHS